MRLVPDTLPAGVKSDAERRLFRSLQQAAGGPEAVCYHSLRLSEHEYKREGELDFVLLSSEGLYVLEVKGGGVARDESGIWSFTDRFGEARRRVEGPFQQAQSGMYALLNLIKGRYGDDATRNLAYGYGVVFPDCTFHVDSAEWPREIILDAESYRSNDDVEKYLRRLQAYWRGKRAHAPHASVREVDLIARFLRPKFERVPSLANRAEEVDRELVTLTEEQYDRLDAAERNRRILCTGGAGTGKTFLAAEIARRHADRGQTTAVVCRSATLAAFLRSRLPPAVSVIPLERQAPEADPFDVIVVDEGQDLLNMDRIDVLDRLVKGGLEKGIWRVFFDANNQSGIHGAFDSAALELLESFGATYLDLTRNCRNTLNIVEQTRLMTGADLGVAAAGAGPKVEYRYVADTAEAANVLAQALYGLYKDDVRQGEISILSPVRYRDSVAAKLPARLTADLVVLDEHTAGSLPVPKITFATVTDFKGLENRFVFVTDLGPAELAQDGNLSTLYVAMSRARAGLFVILDKSLEDAVVALAAKHLEKMQEHRAKGRTWKQ